MPAILYNISNNGEKFSVDLSPRQLLPLLLSFNDICKLQVSILCYSPFNNLSSLHGNNFHWPLNHTDSATPGQSPGLLLCPPPGTHPYASSLQSPALYLTPTLGTPYMAHKPSPNRPRHDSRGLQLQLPPTLATPLLPLPVHTAVSYAPYPLPTLPHRRPENQPILKK